MKKKDWFSHKTGIVFMHGDIFKDGYRNSTTFKMKLFATISNGRAYNQWTVVFACCYGNLTIFRGKIKIKLKWPCTEGRIRYDFLHFFENANYFLFHQRSVSFRILITKMKTGIIVDFIFRCFINRSNDQHMF